MMPPGRGQFEPQGHGWQDLWRRLLNIDTHKISKLWASWFKRRCFFYVFSYYKSMEANDPRGVANGPQGHDRQDLWRVPLNVATY